MGQVIEIILIPFHSCTEDKIRIGIGMYLGVVTLDHRYVIIVDTVMGFRIFRAVAFSRIVNALELSVDEQQNRRICHGIHLQ